MEIFISHSNKDADIAEAMIDLLRAALNLSSEEIRCTSVNGYRLPTGASTEEQLRQEIYEARVLIGLITNVSLKSYYVLFELGARWGANNFLAPVLAGGVDPSGLPGPLKGRNAINCDDQGQVQQLVEDIAKQLDRKMDRGSSFLKNIDALVHCSKLKSSKSEKEEKVDTNDSSSHLDKQDFQSLPTPHKPKLEMEVEISPRHGDPQVKRYDLAITIINTGETTIKNYRVEIEIPNAFIDQSGAAEVQGGQTRTHRLFRNTNEHFHNRILYPRDSLRIISISYFVDAKIAETDAIKESMQIKAYAGDELVSQKIIPMNEAAKFPI